MSGWGQVVQCEAVDQAENRCVLPAGHGGDHAVGQISPVSSGRSSSRPSPRRVIVIVVGLVLLVVAETIDLVLTAVAYYGLGDAEAILDLAFLLMPIGWLALAVGFMFSATQPSTAGRRPTEARIATGCAAAVLLQIPVGLLALMSAERSADLVSDATLILAFAIPGLLLLGHIWMTPHILGRGSLGTSPGAG